MAIRDFRALWSPPKCNVIIFVVIHDMSLKSLKNKVSCHTPQKTDKGRWDYVETQRTRKNLLVFAPWCRRCSKSERCRGKCFGDRRSLLGGCWVAMGCWRCGVKTWVIWGASWVNRSFHVL
jgi:hypothetical protein